MEFLALKVGKPRPTSVVRGGITISNGGKIDVYESDSPFSDPKEVGKEAEDYGIEEYGLVCWDGDNLYKVIEE